MYVRSGIVCMRRSITISSVINETRKSFLKSIFMVKANYGKPQTRTKWKKNFSRRESFWHIAFRNVSQYFCGRRRLRWWLLSSEHLGLILKIGVGCRFTLNDDVSSDRCRQQSLPHFRLASIQALDCLPDLTKTTGCLAQILIYLRYFVETTGSVTDLVGK
jgi:hypothetical protein